ncbi:MAG: septum formation protein Maf [Chloroflexi bacterium AL-N10]|nr:septum formation protein Maf [Chloroflexi bacterium AL-N1]NOK69580.1 septum formation protein Maf [Chloroflexi bacterium AL-N10]NOK72127.1 septum formation protein Maf [Chloroflexi bacterium AL-N5]
MSTQPPPLVLASASPRRRELLRYLTPSFRIVVTNAEEQWQDAAPASVIRSLPQANVPLTDHPSLTAWYKVRIACTETPDSVIIGADTIVVLDGLVLNKPTTPDDACSMLQRLSGQTHTVYTGIVVVSVQQQTWFDVVASEVTIAPLSRTVIEDYVNTGEPLDKAGAYGIQGLGGQLVQSVTGSYTNVVGLPLTTVHQLLAFAGIPNLVDPSDAYQHWLSAQGKEPLPCPPTLP